MSKTHFMILGIILSLCIISGGVYLKMKHDERENKRKSTTKNNKNVFHFTLNTTPKNPIPLNS